MGTSIAITGMACRYPDADSPQELWRNVLSGRRAFRRIPPGRLSLEDYISQNRADPDRTYATQAAVLDGWRFDRVRHKIAGGTYRSTDLTHWLALEVAGDALRDAAYPRGRAEARRRTGVIIGNTLTGEFSRASTLRLRWPYVRRTFAAALAAEGWTADRSAHFLSRVEKNFKAPFAPANSDTLAGGLSNTIAGRICNYFDLHGGGYTVDGACSSSLLSVTTACAALADGEVDFALAGGVDLSLDPFELVGFARVGALADDAMRVFDARPQGFWPGEGCGVVVLERLSDALARGRRPYAVICGWGLSSDGAGGLTRPEAGGQMLALARAYRRAGFGIGSVDLFEAHGTGTEAGDTAELTALGHARRNDRARAAAPISSIKANIGHTKAAAGVAGLIKATLALHERVIPPATSCEVEHPLLSEAGAPLRVTLIPEAWPHGDPGRAGVSAMGFGGINAHAVLRGFRRRRRLTPEQRALAGSSQDAELVVFAADTQRELKLSVDAVRSVAEGLSLAELSDLAAQLAREHGSGGPARAALIAATPHELVASLDSLGPALGSGELEPLSAGREWFVGYRSRPLRIGFLFPGQGSPTVLDGGALGRRFGWFKRMASRPAAESRPRSDTEIAQPAIVACSLGAAVLLDKLGVKADVAVGHSLGELSALSWGGRFTPAETIALAEARGVAMAGVPGEAGAMANLAAEPAAVEPLLRDGVAIAGYNGPSATVISGPADAVAEVMVEAERRGVRAVGLPVSYAFHSPQMAAAEPELAAALGEIPKRRLGGTVISSVTGGRLDAEVDAAALLIAQLTQPVQFARALAVVQDRTDLMVEVGPGSVLSGLARAGGETAVFSLDAGGPRLRPTLQTVAALFAGGATRSLEPLFAGRFTRPFSLDRPRSFLANPCESAPRTELPETTVSPGVDEGRAAARAVSHGAGTDRGALAAVRALVAARTELPEEAIEDRASLLGDLHLSSIAVAELTAQAAADLGLSAPPPPTELANATVGELAAALEAAGVAGTAAVSNDPDGVRDWVRWFSTVWVRGEPLRPSAAAGRWVLICPDDHPLASELPGAFECGDGEVGVAVCIPPGAGFQSAGLLLSGAQAAAAIGAQRCLFLQHEPGAAGFAKSLALERPELSVAVVTTQPTPAGLRLARGEAEAVSGFAEVRYSPEGRRLVPELRLTAPSPSRGALGPDDVALVTGGGKGITAECALALAKATGAAIGLLGRGRPESDPDLAGNLERLTAAGIRYRYEQADVTDALAVQSAVRRVVGALGPVTTIVHGAGINVPVRIDDLDDRELDRTLAPKLDGLTALIDALDPARLRLVVSFGSIIARIGMRGEGHYALANELMGLRLEKLGRELPHCRCLNIEWSVWSGAGMGDRLGVVAALSQSGVRPIPVDEGVRQFVSLVASDSAGSLVVTGRFGPPATVSLVPDPLPALRFLERPRVRYPGVEIVAEASVSRGTDAYVDDHVIDGVRVLPAVVALEAMSSSSAALGTSPTESTIEDVRFDRVVTVPAAGVRGIRLAGLRGTDGTVDVALRSEETGYQVDHFAARIRPRARTSAALEAPPVPDERVELDPHDLYGQLLFQGTRFRRLVSFRRLHAWECIAEIKVERSDPFGQFLPQEVCLGDFAARDAALHAVQACLPHRRLLPVAVRSILPAELPPGRAFVHARERLARGDRYVYDVTISAVQGDAIERWSGLELRAVGELQPPARWPLALLVPFVERRFSELTAGVEMTVCLMRRQANGNADAAIRSAVGSRVSIMRRYDGRPESGNGLAVSAAHLDGYTLAVARPGLVACDFETITARPAELWRGMLGPERMALARVISTAGSVSLDQAATQVWSATECLKKAGLSTTEPLKVKEVAADGWTLLRASEAIVATLVTHAEQLGDPLVIGLLAEDDGS